MESHRVHVFGSDYSVRADGGAEHVRKVAEIVDARMREIDRQFQPGSGTRTAVLACMNLVDEQLREGETVARWARRRVGTLIDKLEAVL
ncbi:cell division protein ZapA [candidate division WOR-3 bacterium]|nr:cell division protein ZapA [candidate division WOR-3 bacterium]